MPEDQINEVFDAMFEAVRTKQPAGRDISGVPSHARPVEEPKKVEAPSADELKEMFDANSEKFNPQAAIAKIIEANYSPLLQDISRNASVGVKAAVRAQLPDFATFEKDIDEVLATMAPGAINQNTIVDTYFRVKGFRATQEMFEKSKVPPKVVPPSPPKVESDRPKLTAEDEAVARVMFRGAADPIAEFHKAASMMDNQNMRVPGDPPRKK